MCPVALRGVCLRHAASPVYTASNSNSADARTPAGVGGLMTVAIDSQTPVAVYSPWGGAFRRRRLLPRCRSLNTPVTCAKACLGPNDIVVADADGVVVGPHAHVAEILYTAQALDNTEHSMLPFIN